jgi:hypothetical protein
VYDPRIELEPTIFLHPGGIWAAVAAGLLGLFILSRRRPDWALTAVLTAAPLYQVRGHLGVPTTLLELVLLTVVAGVATKWRRYSLAAGRYGPWLALWVGAALVAALIGPDRHEGLGLWRAFFFEPTLYFLAVTAVFRGKSLRPLLWGALGGLVVLAGWTGWLLADGRAITYDGRLLGPYQSPNYFTLLLGPLLLVTALWPRRELILPRLALGTVGLLMFFAANSRGGELGLLAGLTIGLLFLQPRWRKWLGAGIIGTVLVGGALLGPRLIEHQQRQVVSARPVIWHQALVSIEHNPLFGNGPGQFQDVFRERVKDNPDYLLYVAPQALNPHNVVLVTCPDCGFADYHTRPRDGRHQRAQE